MSQEKKSLKSSEIPEIQTSSLPVLPLRDVVVFPHMVIPLFVGRKRSINALDMSMSLNRQVLLVTQKSLADEEVTAKSLYTYGAVATILQLLKLPDGTVKVLVEGIERGRVKQFKFEEKIIVADVEIEQSNSIENKDTEILMRAVINTFEQYVKLNKKIPPEVIPSITSIEDPSRLADTISAHLTIKLEEKQVLLETIDVNDRLEKLLAHMEGEIDIIQIENRIRGRVKRQMEKTQREYYLNEQRKAIDKELGELENSANEMEELENKIKKSQMPEEALKKAESEFQKLKKMPPMSAEATVVRTYIDWLVSLPWKKRSKIKFDLETAEAVLNEDHYGLEKIKERILEYLAVQKRVKKLKGPILCLVGPPGVGKTSLGQSIARAIGRKFVRFALGGVRDEAEIRGHRRTYIGSMPGKILQKLAKVQTNNPLFMLDEIDKMAMDFRGDPASALLEVLDPEQNHTFNDHYMEIDYDLSEVMFIATANSMHIPGPLLDRMEVIRLSGYTEDEKVHIALRHLIPKQIEANGLAKDEIEIQEDAVRSIVRYYTREAGVRSLEREISKICRKVVKELSIVEKKAKAKKTLKNKTKIKVNADNIENYLGIQRFRFGLAEEFNQIGQVTGLAWTEVGGELLTIETAVIPGKGKTTYTGQLGGVMQESIQAAMTVVRGRSEILGIAPDFYEKYDIHVHVPEGATPKDGPSAGISMCTALVSALTKIPVRADVGMTGEITLRGDVLPIGGLKEKLLAALRGGLKHVIIPFENKRELKEIPQNICEGLMIHPVKKIDEVLEIALTSKPKLAGNKPVKVKATKVSDNTKTKAKTSPKTNTLVAKSKKRAVRKKA